ncbi:FxsA protein [Candidatus Rhodobacter oscarellae]|uniref:FxsA protein n=1 Tax=Candidatus Rhodobacter oscarellae TaxID=1675527 RepID=A0A0J9GZK7_9RHOB|nr:FxsA family protein [Candidatus Rhodobacter lobularis]KMW58908.1 FxsA protein [Candidatus Rhodobacter lobularis]
MWLFALFVAVPLIEIALFIQIGGAIGLGWTLLIVVITAILGTWLVRAQGLRALADLQNSFQQLNDPTEHLAHGAMILFSGALLLTPGFFTDTVGFLLLVPQVRLAVFGYVRARVKVAQFSMGSAPRPGTGATRDDVIDGEFEEVATKPEEVDRPKSPTHGTSGWTRH